MKAKQIFIMLALPMVMGFISCSDNHDMGIQPVNPSTGIDLNNLDPSVQPANDFYQYANGGWMEKNPLPPAYSCYGVAEILSNENDARIKEVLDGMLESNYPIGSVEQKLSDLYRSAMDMDRRNQDGVQPLMGIIQQIEEATTSEDLFQIQLQLALQNYVNTLDNVGFTFPFMTFFLSPDSKDATQNILEVDQGGIMLEDKEYYLDTDATMADIREAYQQHIIEMMQLFGFTEEQATQKMTNILRIETELAKVSRSGTELRDPEANYNKMTLAHFESQYPHVHLEKLMNAVGIQSVCMPELVVGQPEFFTGADKLIASMTVDEYRDYLEWINIKLAAGYLDDKTRATYYEFFGKVMSGRQEDYPLWERVMDQMNEQMGDALGKIYVDKYFPPAAKERVLQLVKNLQTAFSEHIETQDWLSDATKAVCKDKLNAFIVMMGYPDKWIDMSALTIDPQKSYYENIVSCLRFRGAYDIEHKAGKPVDRSEWEMSPQTVNAYYNPFSNAICFPAGILQPPFFDMEADDAYNYGSIGAVIGHEMSHGFDDQGRHYDKEGNLTNWWTPEDEARFNEKASVLADFFDQIEVLPGLHANGRMTLGENLADLCGLKVAWSAYKKATKNNPLPTIDGLTADQRFFLAYAYSYAENITDARIRQQTIGNVHSVARWRVNGIVPHFNAWYDAFDVKEGDKMYIPKASRVDLW